MVTVSIVSFLEEPEEDAKNLSQNKWDSYYKIEFTMKRKTVEIALACDDDVVVVVEHNYPFFVCIEKRFWGRCH